MKNRGDEPVSLEGLDHFYAAACDLNGVWRGKRLPAEQLEKVLGGAMRMPVSAMALDIWGQDVADSPLVFESGDQDGICMPTGRGILPTTIKNAASALMPLNMLLETGESSPADPRQILAGAVERAAKLGLRAVMALEMEFYLVDPQTSLPQAPHSPATRRQLHSDSILSIDELSEFQGFFDDVYANAKVQDIPADTTICEAGLGQFEINLLHSDDPLKSADDAVFFKRIVKSVARAHDLRASFMAKPYLDAAGSGMHVHFSLLNEAGENVFNNGKDDGSDELRHAVAGLLASMEETALIWAPHLNSYRRLQPSSHAPTGVCWGYENRTAAIRIPGGKAEARRLEHRIAGADANPYLILAFILHGALDGIEGKLAPPKPIEGDAYSLEMARLPQHWIDGIAGFEASDFVKRNFDPMFHEVYAKMKRQEYTRLSAAISQAEIDAYMDVV